MSVLARFLALALIVPTLTGCITSETLIRLNADRSGTIEQLILVNMKTLEELPRMMGEMMGGEGKSSASSSSKASSHFDTFDEAQLRADAATLGEGVRFVSTEKVVRGDMQGAKVVYAFDDVNALTIRPDPPMGAIGEAGPKTGDSDPLGLEFARLPNGNTLLTVRLDEAGGPNRKKTSGADKTGSGEMPAGMEDMMRQMFDGFRVAIDVEVNGAIVGTSSPFVEGSRVTVLEMDLGLLLRDRANLKTFEKIEPGASVAEMMPLLRDVKGIKVNQSPLTIEFTGR
ncbi:MAG: hypothetical protein IT183_06200 [Acidobacteria bacterium]|nr:hypothetical protein [Acidobacteriota bacterium]